MAQPGAAGAGQAEPVTPTTRSLALAAYVATLGPGPAIPEPEQYDPAGLSEEEIARGGELFRTNCSACHNFEGAGGALPNGKYAPSLFGVSNLHLYEAMITGPQQMPVFSDEVLTTEDKRAIIGYLNELHAQPNRGGLALGGLGPGQRGSVGVGRSDSGFWSCSRSGSRRRERRPMSRLEHRTGDSRRRTRQRDRHGRRRPLPRPGPG